MATIVNYVLAFFILLGAFTFARDLNKVTRALLSLRDPDRHPFPSVSRCPVCGKRIYVWQKFDRRTYDVPVAFTDALEGHEFSVRSNTSMLTHTACTGEPILKPSVLAIELYRVSTVVHDSPSPEARPLH